MLNRRLGKALTRIGDLPPACLEFLFEIGAGLASPTNARLRSGQVKLATSRSTVRSCIKLPRSTVERLTNSG